MAETIILTNDAQTRKKWAKDLYSIVMPATEINYLLGSGSGAIIEERTDLAKGEGDVIKFDIMLPLVGEGRVGREKVEGNEEELVFKDFNLTIEELNHAVNTGGKMDEQRIPYPLMEKAKSGLQYWWASKLSDMAFATLCGDTTYTVAGHTFGQAPVAPDSDHHLKVNDVAEASMTEADIMDLNFLDRMKQLAEVPTTTNCFKIRPLVLNGKNYYRVILHNYVFDQLKNNTNIGQWGDLLRAAGKLNQPQVEIEYNGMLISKSERIRRMVADTTETRAGVFRNLFLGCQACAFAWGGAGESKSTTMSFVPYTTDAERFMNVRGGGIFGMKVVRFAGYDFGRIVGSSWGTPLK